MGGSIERIAATVRDNEHLSAGYRKVFRILPSPDDEAAAVDVAKALADVVRHCSEIDEDRLHADGESILKPLHLTLAETADLIAFLESLDERAVGRTRQSSSNATSST